MFSLVLLIGNFDHINLSAHMRGPEGKMREDKLDNGEKKGEEGRTGACPTDKEIVPAPLSLFGTLGLL